MRQAKTPFHIERSNPTWLVLWCTTAFITLYLFVGQLQKGLPIVSEISYLLPSTQDAVKQDIIAHQNESFRRRYLLLISSPEQSITQEVHDELSAKAAQYGFTSSLKHSFPAGYLALLQRYPFAFVHESGTAGRAFEGGNTDALSQSALNYWLSFNAPSFLTPAQDPLGLAGNFFQSQNTRLNQHADGVLTPIPQPQQSRASWQQILPLSSAQADSALESQQKTFQSLQQLIANANIQFPGAHITATGLVVHSVLSAEQTQQEIFIISIVATLSIVLMSLAVYRRLLPLLAAFITIAFGGWVGIVFCIAFFSQIHILAIAFGTSLMGVVVDYSFHYFSVQRRTPTVNKLGPTIIRLIFPGICLSLITAVAGYFGLWQTGMEVLQQIAFLCVAGLFASVLTIIAIYPKLPTIELPARHLPIERLLTLIARSWQRVPTNLIYTLFGLLLLLAGYLLYHNHHNPSLAAFYTPPASLKETDKNIALIYKDLVPNQYLAVTAGTPDELIKRLHQLKPNLERLIAQSVIQSYSDLGQWVPNPDTLGNDAVIYSALLHNPALQTYFSQLDINPNDLRQLTQIPPSLEWINQLPEAIRDSLFVQLTDGRVAGLVRFTGLKNTDALRSAISDSNSGLQNTDTGYIDTLHTLSEGLTLQTQRASLGLSLAFGMAFCSLFVFYRNATALALIAVPLASCAITLCLIIVFGNLSLFHLLALFLALGLGVDYAILFSHSGKFPEGVSAEIVSLAAVGNALSFGLLSFTSLPMLAAFGVATSICLICNFIFAPLVVRWVNRP